MFTGGGGGGGGGNLGSNNDIDALPLVLLLVLTCLDFGGRPLGRLLGNVEDGDDFGSGRSSLLFLPDDDKEVFVSDEEEGDNLGGLPLFLATDGMMSLYICIPFIARNGYHADLDDTTPFIYPWPRLTSPSS